MRNGQLRETNNYHKERIFVPYMAEGARIGQFLLLSEFMKFPSIPLAGTLPAQKAQWTESAEFTAVSALVRTIKLANSNTAKAWENWDSKWTIPSGS